MISVIIPTYKRNEILDICLGKFLIQDFKDFEIIVVEDGGDDSKDVIKKFDKKLNIKFFSQKKKGQGAARNLGIENAQGEIVIFIGDDILVEKNFLKSHSEFHLKHPRKNYACLGLTKFHSKFQNSFSNWLEDYGFQFDFKKLEKGFNPNFWHFYTSNISLKKELFFKENFDEDFSTYGFEDIELGYRLHKKENLKIQFEPQALAYHYHEITKESFLERMRSVGAAARIFEKKHPGVGALPKGIKLQIQKIISRNSKALSLIKKEWGYYALGKKAFLKGAGKI